MEDTRLDTFQDSLIKSPFETSHPILARMHREADSMQYVIETPVDLDVPATLTERLKQLDVYLARLGDMRVRVKAMREVARNRYLDEHADELSKMSATVSNRVISKCLFEYTVAVDRMDSMYDTVSKLSKDLVTQISYIKTEMQLS